MSLLLGLLDRKGSDATKRTIEELKRGSPAKADCYGIASKADCIPRIHNDSLIRDAYTALGYKLVKIEELDKPQPMMQESQAVAFIGRLLDSTEPSFLAFANAIRENSDEDLRLLYQFDGSFSAVTLVDDCFTLYRDTLGIIPLYYGINQDYTAVASNSKILRNLGLVPERVKPGYISKLNVNSILEKKISHIERPQEVEVSEEEAMSYLDQLLIESLNRRVKKHNSPTIAFSGGVDSSLLTYYAMRAGAKPHLECVGVEGSTDFRASLEAADALGLRVSQHLLSLSDVERMLPEVIESIEETDPMKVGVALPLYVVARNAQIHGSKVVLSGNGCDELFGGYSKYFNKGIDPREEMYLDLINSHAVNLERDWKICADIGVELRLPYTDRRLVEFGLKLPLNYKLSLKSGERKIIIRKLAKKAGFPDAISNRAKKAAQYSSGVSKAMNKLAKSRKLTVKDYLRSLGRFNN